MSTKTSKTLHIFAFILILLTMVFVLVGWLFLKEWVIGLMSGVPEYQTADIVPWENIIEAGFVLFIALIWLIILLTRPGRGATITWTIILSVLLIAYYAFGIHYLATFFIGRMTMEGGNYAAYSIFKSAMTILSHFGLVPGGVLMLLSMGGACGKSFKETHAAEPEPAEMRRPEARPAPAQPQYGYGQQAAPQQMPTFSAGAGYRPQENQWQTYQQPSAMQNTGYIPKMEAFGQDTGYIPKADTFTQDTGYIPKVEAPMQNTGYIPNVEPSVPDVDDLYEIENPVQNFEQMPLAQEQTPAAEQPKPASQIIYPWQKAAGAPKEQAEPEEKTE